MTAWKMLFGTLIVGKMTAVEVLARGGGFDKAPILNFDEVGGKLVSL